MTKQELIKWFDNYFNNCYYVIHSDYPESIFMFYDLKYVRKLKLDKIKGENITYNNVNIVGECLFQLDYKSTYFWCDYRKIWKYISDNYSSNYKDIQKFIKDRLEEHSKMNVMTPVWRSGYLAMLLEEHSKMNVMTPRLKFGLMLEEHSKMNVMTPCKLKLTEIGLLEEHSKMNVMTPGDIDDCSFGQLEEHSKMNVMTPTPYDLKKMQLLEEHSKMNVMTPGES